MNNKSHISARLREPLTETTRKARKNLVVISVIGIIITKVGLIPTKISAFGIEFSHVNQEALLTLLSVLAVYLLLTFLVYFYSEVEAWKVDMEEDEHNDWILTSDPASKYRKRILATDTRQLKYYLRLFVEFIAPIAFALYSIYFLITTPLT